MKQTQTALTLVATMFASSASAADPDDLQKLEDTNDCVTCDLRAAYMTGASLRSANLRFSDLRDADLKEANLRGAFLEGAYMNGAILCNTIMPDASVIYSGC